MNRIGTVGHQVMAFSFFFVLFMIAVGIVLGVLIVYGEEYEFREADAKILNYNIRKCIFSNEINEDFFNDNKFYDVCNLNKNVLLEQKYIIKVCESDECVLSEEAKVSLGSDFNPCLFEGTKDNKFFPKCEISRIKKDTREFIVVTGANQEVSRG